VAKRGTEGTLKSMWVHLEPVYKNFHSLGFNADSQYS
jgi:hypothetical protein